MEKVYSDPRGEVYVMDKDYWDERCYQMGECIKKLQMVQERCKQTWSTCQTLIEEYNCLIKDIRKEFCK